MRKRKRKGKEGRKEGRWKDMSKCDIAGRRGGGITGGPGGIVLYIFLSEPANAYGLYSAYGLRSTYVLC